MTCGTDKSSLEFLDFWMGTNASRVSASFALRCGLRTRSGLLGMKKYIKSLFNLYSSCSHITKENFDKSDNIFLIDSWLMRNSLTTNFTKTAWDCEKMDTGKFLGDKKKMLTRWTKSSKRQKLVNTHWIKLVINNLTLSRHQKNLPFSCNIILWFQRTWAASVL